MKKYLLILVSLNLFISISHGQTLVLKKSKTPFFRNGEWVMDISEIKIYDDDLIFGRIKFNEDEHALDTIQFKINQDESTHLNLSTLSAYLDNNTVSEVGDGLIDFYSTKFKKKYTRDFLYFVSTADTSNYLTIIIDIEKSGTFYPLVFSINKILKGKGNFEVHLLDTKKQLSDFRLVRIQQ